MSAVHLEDFGNARCGALTGERATDLERVDCGLCRALATAQLATTGHAAAPRKLTPGYESGGPILPDLSGVPCEVAESATLDNMGVLEGGKSVAGLPGGGAEVRMFVDVGTTIIVRAEDGEPRLDKNGPPGRPGAGFRFQRLDTGELVIRMVSWSSDDERQQEETARRRAWYDAWKKDAAIASILARGESDDKEPH